MARHYGSPAARHDPYAAFSSPAASNLFNRQLGTGISGEKMAWLLNKALDVKRDILTMVYVADDSGNPLGWVYREYVVCKGETRH
jgi:hypothetical protein